MLEARIHHKASAESVGSILTDGLRCGVPGPGAREDPVQQANHHLNALRPDHVHAAGLDRNGCTYCYLVVDGRVFDVDSGLLVPEPDWQVDEGSVALQLAVDPATAYVGDLEAFDELAEHIGDGPDGAVHELARRYWDRVVALPTLCTYYELAEHALVRHPEAPARLPSRLERVEVLLTADVPPDRITRVTGGLPAPRLRGRRCPGAAPRR